MNPNENLDQDPLAAPASSTNTDYPLLKPEKIYRFNIKDASVEDVESEGAVSILGAGKPIQQLVIKLATTKDERDVNDEVLHAGFGVPTNIGLYAKGGRTLEAVKRDLATYIKAVEGKGSQTPLRAVIDNPRMFVDKVVDARVGIQKDKNGIYPDRNTVRFLIPT